MPVHPSVRLFNPSVLPAHLPACHRALFGCLYTHFINLMNPCKSNFPINTGHYKGQKQNNRQHMHLSHRYGMHYVFIKITASMNTGEIKRWSLPVMIMQIVSNPQHPINRCDIKLRIDLPSFSLLSSRRHAALYSHISSCWEYARHSITLEPRSRFWLRNERNEGTERIDTGEGD